MSIVDKAVWTIETRLKAPLDLTTLADLCASSPYHLSRSFRRAHGLAPLTYLRARRLSEAAKALVEGQSDILNLALDMQYGSHEAFTRAFVHYFGQTPSQLRSLGHSQNLKLMEPLKMDSTKIVDVDAPEMRDHAAFQVTGLQTQCKTDDISAISPLWQSFAQRMSELETQGPAYGVSHSMTKDGGFTYMAGAKSAKTPEGMEKIDVSAGRYAVFTFKGNIASFPNYVYSIWNKALPDAGLKPAPQPEFELYDQRFNPMTGQGTIEYWVPIEAA